MITTNRTRRRRGWIAALVAAGLVATGIAGAPAIAAVPGFPDPTEHSQEAFAPDDDFTSRWTRADARQLKAMSDPTAPPPG